MKFTYLAQLGLADQLAPAVVLKQDPAGGLTDALANTRASIFSERLHTALTEGDYAKVSPPSRPPRPPAAHPKLKMSASATSARRSQAADALGRAPSAKLEGPCAASARASPPAPCPPRAQRRPLASTSKRAAIALRLEDESAPDTPVAAKNRLRARRLHSRRRPSRPPTTRPDAKKGPRAPAAQQGQAARASADHTLEKLGETEAIAAYQDVIDSPLESEHADHAQRNRDFVWKRDFDSRISTTTAGLSPRASEPDQRERPSRASTRWRAVAAVSGDPRQLRAS